LKKVPPLELTKYDVSQKIIQNLADLEARAILFSLVKKEKTVEELSYHLKIPLSTVYSKIRALKELHLIKPTRTDFTDRGNIITYYKSQIRQANIIIEKNQPVLELYKNKNHLD
jgi:DNA-binding transcriptional ArsR family regulator